MARAIANEFDALFIRLDGRKITAELSSDAESFLRKAFEKAEKNAPAVIFIENIHAIAPKREKTDCQEGESLSLLLYLMESIRKKAIAVVMAGTTRASSIDPVLLCSRGFDCEVDIGKPNTAGRLEILRIHTKNMKLADDVDVEKIADETGGFVGAELAVCSHALELIRENMDRVDVEFDRVDAKILASLTVSRDHFIHAIEAAGGSVESTRKPTPWVQYLRRTSRKIESISHMGAPSEAD